MGYIFGAIILLILSISFLIIGVCFRKDGDYYEETKQFGNAKIVGYEHHDQSRVSSYFVNLLDCMDDHTYICSGNGLCTADYPIGTVIEVEYSRGKKFGIEYVEVHFANSRTADKRKIGKVLINISKVHFVLAFVLVIFFFINQ